MEKIVYILGAGFSAPLGLPVMSNFLEKSKDQYSIYPEKYAHFNDIFKHQLPQIHVASDHYQTNVFNIEDILSILEFRARLDNSADEKQRLAGFLRYLKDVIGFYTPTTELQSNRINLFADHKWIDVICKDDNGNVQKSYDDFVKYPKYRFVSAKLEDYLEQNRLFDNREGRVYFALEQAHEVFINQ